MSKREEFITVIDTLKALSSIITDEQRKALLQQAVQQYEFSFDEANEILKESGLAVGEEINYFDVLGLSIEEFQIQDEESVAFLVEETHKKAYSASLRAGGLPRPDGRTQEQWRNLLNQARDTLIDRQKRSEHIAMLQTEISNPEITIRQEELSNIGPISAPEGMAHIPAGEFQMGSSDGDPNEKPVHTVYVDAFYMDRFPVTNAQYKSFVEANPQWSKSQKWYELKKIAPSILSKYHDGDYLKDWDSNNFPIGKGNHPVTYVSWYAAMAYAQWVDKRLPTEAEWEKAARGGLTGQKYPGGNDIKTNEANFGMNVGETATVGEYPPNNYGLYDIAGNVWEWCLDAYESDFYRDSPLRNPVAGIYSLQEITYDFMNIDNYRVLRGGSWGSEARRVSVAYRDGYHPSCACSFRGFRCARTVNSHI